jgi:hypothetical protein
VMAMRVMIMAITIIIMTMSIEAGAAE